MGCDAQLSLGGIVDGNCLERNVRGLSCRVVNVCNSLPDTVGFTSLAVFKRSIRTVDFSEFLKCNDV